ncbi:hypothetical protein BJY24_005789 [Nocardia transvalensis]|uniref:DUF8176 domain-containing protein n=1 Tax=Nocardia transvalensis TaxID=37333 RepID=A0A7W9UL05_9NOCA|nr:hypothetical protein [Nocardia transvalensis]MBB5916877.1 hypothetical protein [Nocardia transvalensis]
MPHNTITDTEPDHGWGWLNTTTVRTHPTAQPPTPATSTDHGGEWQWLTIPADHPTDRPSAPDRPSRRALLPRRGWIVLAATATATTVLVAGGALAAHHPESRTAIPARTATPPTTSAAAAGGACAGLAGTVVTDGAGDTSSVTTIVAAFDYAYYRLRSAEAALRLVAPEAAMAPDALAAGIASIPAGTTHCVAVTPIDPATAAVHVAEVHPDRQRVDYLQLVNTRPADGGGVLITNIQAQR